jgi:hypothetical protein
MSPCAPPPLGKEVATLGCRADRDHAGSVTEDHYKLPTPRTALAARYARVLVFCSLLPPSADADLRALVDQGRGDVPLVRLRFRCGQCQTGNTNFVVTSKDNPQPW